MKLHKNQSPDLPQKITGDEYMVKLCEKTQKRVKNKELNFRQVSDDNGYLLEEHIHVFDKHFSLLGDKRDENVLVIGVRDHYLLRCFADYFFNGTTRYISFDRKRSEEIKEQQSFCEERLVHLGGFSSEEDCHLDDYLCKWEYKDINIVVDLMSNPHKKVNFSKFKLQRKGSLYIMLNTKSMPFPEAWEKGENYDVACVERGQRPKPYHERDTIVVFRK
jgi:hypothetical protein